MNDVKKKNNIRHCYSFQKYIKFGTSSKILKPFSRFHEKAMVKIQFYSEDFRPTLSEQQKNITSGHCVINLCKCLFIGKQKNILKSNQNGL